MAGRVGNEGYNYFSDKAYENLKNAIDLLIKYQNIQHKTSLDGAKAIQSQLDKQEKYANQLKEMGVSLDANVEHLQREYELETEIYKARKESSKQTDKALKEQNKQLEKINKERERSNVLSKFQRDFQNKISDISEDEIKHRKELNAIMDEANEKAKDLRLSEEGRNKILDEYSTKYKKLNQQYALQQRQTQAKKDFGMSIANTLTGVTSQDITDVKEGTYGLKLASKVFAEAVSKFANAVKAGIDKNYDTIEGTLNRITASNNMSWSKGSFSFGNKTYSGFSNVNNAITDQLKADGLYNNIANTDVMEATAKLTSSSGFGIEEAVNKGYQDTVIKYIVPYLDTASEAFESLEMALPGVSKNVAAIAITTRDQFGESQYLSKYSNQLVELMQPVALQANKDLYSEQYQAIVAQAQAMLKSGELSSAAEAQGYVNDAFQMYMNPYSSISNGNTMQKWTAINTVAQGGVDDPSAYLSNLVGNTEYLYNNLSGSDSLTRSMAQYYYGARSFRNINTSKADKTKSLLKDYKNKSTDELDDIYDDKVSDADNYNSTTQKWDTLVTNTTSILGELKSLVSRDLWDVGELIVKGITTYLGAKVIGGVIGKSLGILGGTAGGGSGAGILASGGGIAMGAFATAAGIVLTGLIADGITKANAENMGKNVDYYNTTGEFDQFNKTDSEGNTIAPSDDAKTLLSYGLDKAGSKGWGGNIADALNFFGNYKANPLMGWGVSRKDRNQAIWEKELQLIGAQNLSAKDTAKAELAWLMIADASGVIDEIDDWSSAKIKSAFSSIYDSDEDASYWVSRIQKWGNFYNPQISTSAGKTTTYVTPKDFKNYHRQGLDEVPYDNYVASLHEGEAVLTASTANELRNLLDEYRNNNQSSANLDVIIQQQTTDLCNKLNEVVTAISRLNVGGGISTTSSNDQAKAQNLLKNSMLHMTNTKRALN